MRGHIRSMVLGAVFLAAVNNVSGAVKDVGEENGYDWGKKSESEKLGYATGYIAGAGEAAHMLGLLAGFLFPGGKEPEGLQRNYEVFVRDLAPVASGVTVGQVMHGLNEFYEDYRNMQIKIPEAVSVVCMEVKGVAKDEVERKTRVLRMPADKREVEAAKDIIRMWITGGRYAQ